MIARMTPLEIVEDLGRDLGQAFAGGFTLSQDDCRTCARAIAAVVKCMKASHHADDTREASKPKARATEHKDSPTPSEKKP